MHLTIRDVMARYKLSRPTIYRLMGIGKFPRPIVLAQKSVRWRQADLDRWEAALPGPEPAQIGRRGRDRAGVRVGQRREAQNGT
jgi:predicted DNA-binding transcriptional regulator AlpA